MSNEIMELLNQEAAGIRSDTVYAEMLRLAETYRNTSADNTGKENVYDCKCGWCAKTIDRDCGVTPFLIRCENCNELAQSRFYILSLEWRMRRNTHEWYRPHNCENLSSQEREHVLKGGLLLRKIVIEDKAEKISTALKALGE